MKDHNRMRAWYGTGFFYFLPYGPLFSDPEFKNYRADKSFLKLSYDYELCTGLKDKNGRLIWEGDIVKMHDLVVHVEYHGKSGYPAFDVPSEHQQEVNMLSENNAWGEIEIIGNVHENPELLK